MKREYMMRGKRIEIDELEQVLAVKTKDQARAQGGALQFGQSAQIHGDGEREAFEQAGWVFVRPEESLLRAFESRAAVSGAEAVQRVFVQPGGRMTLGTDRLSVRLQPDLSEQDARAALDAQGLEILGRLKFAPNLFEVRTAPGTDPLQASVDLSQRPEFVFAEPQFLEHLPGRLTPTDPEYNQQWHLNNTGQNGGTPGADIRAEQAWDMTRGAGVRVAVIDNGMDVAHPDLAAATSPTSAFFNVDGMGSTVFNQGLAGFPDNGHGSFCAGMALARAGNAEGGCGVANEAELVALGCLSDQVGTQVTLARTIAYAADPTQEIPAADPADGVDVIACSLGPNGADWLMTGVLQAAIDFAVANGRGGLGTPIFWAVTNGNFEIRFDEVCAYPSTIAVARSTRNDLEDDAGHGPELDFLATGVDVHSTVSGGGYGNATGTSFAAPTAAGVGALILSLNQTLTWQQVRQLMRDTCDKIGGVAYDASGHNDDYGFGRINAARAVCHAARVIDLDTPAINFNDIPEGERTARAIVFSVQTCQPATFQIVAGPVVTSGPGSFGTLPSPGATLAATTDLSARQARLWLTFTGTNDGDIATGSVTVRLVETGEEWIIPISTNTIARITVGTVLVLDQSGSMAQPSGLAAFPTRNDVLKFAAPAFVNVLQENNGVGIVAFDHDAYDRMPVRKVGPVSALDPDRAHALSIIGAHTPNPLGATAIGDGLENAHNLLAAVAGDFDRLAIVVFTDGFETADKRIADVAPLIGERVFAIGLGTADQIQPVSLTALTNGTGGQLLLTGTIGPDDLFLLSKYYLQILAGVTNNDIVRDPQGAIGPGATHRIAFDVNEADISLDSILLAETDQPVLRYTLETPAGDRITPAVAVPGSGIEYVSARGVRMYRGTLPLPIGVAGAAAGRWHAVLDVDEAAFKRYLSTLDNYPEQMKKVQAHGVRYSLNVQSRSGLRLQARVAQDSNQPGARLTVRAVLTEYGLPLPGARAVLRAEYRLPDGSGGTLAMAEETAGAGIYTASIAAPIAGVYPIRVLADGKSMRGRDFTREHLLTGAVWAGGDNPVVDRPDTAGQTEQVCKLLSCMLGGQVLSPEFEGKLKKLGIDLEAARGCLKGWCRPRQTAGDVRTESSPLTALGAPPAANPELVAAAQQLLAQLAREVGRQA